MAQGRTDLRQPGNHQPVRETPCSGFTANFNSKPRDVNLGLSPSTQLCCLRPQVFWSFLGSKIQLLPLPLKLEAPLSGLPSLYPGLLVACKLKPCQSKELGVAKVSLMAALGQQWGRLGGPMQMYCKSGTDQQAGRDDPGCWAATSMQAGRTHGHSSKSSIYFGFHFSEAPELSKVLGLGSHSLSLTPPSATATVEVCSR